MLEILQRGLEQKDTSDTREQKPDEPVGLSAYEARERLIIDGKNEAVDKRKKSALKIFANQFHDIMVMILLAALAVTIVMGNYSDAVPILIIVVVNALLGFFQEYRCERTLEKLEALTAPTARVYRDGSLITIPANEVVRGDIISIEAGCTVPCDGYVIKCSALSCDESMLNGESEPVMKTPYRNEQELTEIGKPYMLYMGTTVLKGSGLMKACFTGKYTQLGRISGMINDAASEMTPLQKKLAELGKVLAAICVGVCVVVFLAGVFRGENARDMFMTAITVAVAAIPEGLPAAVTIALSLAVRRMLRRNALVHRLQSVETLGCADVICTDKTGTVTENVMTVTDIFTYSESPCEYKLDGDRFRHKQNGSSRALRLLLLSGVLCSNAAITQTRQSEGSRNRGKIKTTYSGDPTEIALLKAVSRFKSDNISDLAKGFTRTAEQPFDSDSKRMSVTVNDKNGSRIVFSKGAPASIINSCNLRLDRDETFTLSREEKSLLTKACERYAQNGLRVLAASADLGSGEIFLGLYAMKDPLRQEARAAVLSCRRAGIRTVMITGDHALTAKSIAREAGIFREGDMVLSGRELDRLSDTQLGDVIESVTVFARVTPAHKLRIVSALKAKGHICAMTGDGVNDAPAVKAADIGVSMGITGTDVTKQAADIILLDDNFATLEGAVCEGRAIYANIRKFVRFLLGCNIGEVLTTLGAILIGMPTILTPSQILLVNLVTDGLPAVALGLEPPEKDVMNKTPRKNSDSFFEGGMLFSIFLRGTLIALSTIIAFWVLLRIGATLACARTGALITLSVSQLIHVFECKSETKPIFRINISDNPSLIASVLISLICLFAAIFLPALSGIFASPGMSFVYTLISILFAAAVPFMTAVFRALTKK
ncbi:MAG: cation-translocating P-type ATPase [Ruminococcus sp.]|nr:cation-translocating P-type ATPase [Ruminococcus sp.]